MLGKTQRKPTVLRRPQQAHIALAFALLLFVVIQIVYNHNKLAGCEHIQVRLTKHSQPADPRGAALQFSAGRLSPTAAATEQLDPSAPEVLRNVSTLSTTTLIRPLHLDAWAWLTFAASDAASQGTVVPPDCLQAQGAPFLQRFQATCSKICDAGQQGQPAAAVSSVECCGYPVDNLGVTCQASNLVVNTTAFLGPHVAEGEQSHRKYLPAGAPGSVRLGCELQQRGASVQPSAAEVSQFLANEPLPWFTSAPGDSQPGSTSAVLGPCSGSEGTRVSHPVMFVSRLDTTNPYHHTQSVIQAFLSIAVFNSSSLTELQVILADHFEAGPFLEIWQRVSQPHRPLLLSSLSSEQQPLCFTNSIHAHFVDPNKAFLGFEGIGEEHMCPSLLLMAASHWHRYLFKELLPAAEQQEYQPLVEAHTDPATATSTDTAELGAHARSSSTNSSGSGEVVPGVTPVPPQQRRLHVVWLSRSWFGRSMKAGGGLTGWQASRDLSHQQESEIVKALEQAVLDWNAAACVQPSFGWWQVPHAVPPQTNCKPSNVVFDFRYVELSMERLYPEQVELLTRTGVLVGIHGAALTNQIWMRPHRGAVVEFSAGGNFHYRNMAASLGHKHFRLASSNVEALAASVRDALDHVSSRYS